MSPGFHEVVDLKNTLKYVLPDDVKVSVTSNDVRLKSDLKINQTLIFIEKSFFCTILGFTRSLSYPLDDINRFYQLIARWYKGDKPINITGIDKVQLKIDCINGSIVNGVREPILYSFGLSSLPGHKTFNQPRIKLFKKINKSILSHITFYLRDDDHKSVDVNGEIISFIRPLIKK